MLVVVAAVVEESPSALVRSEITSGRRPASEEVELAADEVTELESSVDEVATLTAAAPIPVAAPPLIADAS